MGFRGLGPNFGHEPKKCGQISAQPPPPNVNWFVGVEGGTAPSVFWV